MRSTPTTGTVAWPLNAESYKATNEAPTAKITNIHYAVTGSGCSFVVDGTSPIADNGVAKVKYYPLTGLRRCQLHFVSSGSTLHFYDVTAGCIPQMRDGDAVYLSGEFVVTPNQTISSP